ncbi:MAG: MamI family restriction endonuclease [Acidobacteria bacterium]|nr:MamI family restriction endonuclease [Acidobacteriota bacterium]
MSDPIPEAISLLNEHHRAFSAAKPLADKTGHTVPSDTKSFSEILVSLLTGLRGRTRRKGSDLSDGSDVKAASVWSAIDTPRFNGCAPAGRVSDTAKKPNDVSALDDMPFMFFVLWDGGDDGRPRCRVWCVRPRSDREFRRMVATWYAKREAGEIKSTNFQLHPPRNREDNVIRNSCGNLEYPLLFRAEMRGGTYEVVHFDPTVLVDGECRLST